MGEKGETIKESGAVAVLFAFTIGILGQIKEIAPQTSAAEPPPEEPPLTQEQAQPAPAETQIRYNPRWITGELPPYQLTQADKDYLNWLNAQFINWFDWNGTRHLLYIPEEVYAYVRAVEEAGGVPADILIAIGETETGFGVPAWRQDAVSQSGARGIWQIMPRTWNDVAPFPGADPFNPWYGAAAASNYSLKVFAGHNLDNTISRDDWAAHFTGQAGAPPWNEHLGQANATYDLFQTLLDKRAEYLASG